MGSAVPSDWRRSEQSSLPRGVTATHDGHRPGSAGLGLGLGRRVVHPDAFELGQPFQRKPVIPGIRCDDDRPGRNGLAVIEGDPVHASSNDSEAALAASLRSVTLAWRVCR